MSPCSWQKRKVVELRILKHGIHIYTSVDGFAHLKVGGKMVNSKCESWGSNPIQAWERVKQIFFYTFSPVGNLLSLKILGQDCYDLFDM